MQFVQANEKLAVTLNNIDFTFKIGRSFSKIPVWVVIHMALAYELNNSEHQVLEPDPRGGFLP